MISNRIRHQSTNNAACNGEVRCARRRASSRTDRRASFRVLINRYASSKKKPLARHNATETNGRLPPTRMHATRNTGEYVLCPSTRYPHAARRYIVNHQHLSLLAALFPFLQALLLLFLITLRPSGFAPCIFSPAYLFVYYYPRVVTASCEARDYDSSQRKLGFWEPIFF